MIPLMTEVIPGIVFLMATVKPDTGTGWNLFLNKAITDPYGLSLLHYSVRILGTSETINTNLLGGILTHYLWFISYPVCQHKLTVEYLPLVDSRPDFVVQRTLE